jgi:hypothetical protein
VPSVISSRGEHFFEEAICLLRKEDGRLSLTTLQARGILYTWYVSLNFFYARINTKRLIGLDRACGMGREKLAMQQLTEMATYLHKVILNRDTLIEEVNHEGEEMARAIDTAICGLFSLNS